MTNDFLNVQPRFIPPLMPDFRPAALFDRAFRAEAEATGGPPLLIGLEGANGVLFRYESRLLPPDHPHAEANLAYAERLFKFLLWQRGGWRAYVGGPPEMGEALKRRYAPGGDHAFDAHFMGEVVHGRPFEVIPCRVEEVPPEREERLALGGHLEGCRIGFDLGASDIKVAAVEEGEVRFSREIVWEPTVQRDPAYHESRIQAALEEAAAHLPRVDAIGGSAAGIYLDNQTRVASLFRSVPPERYEAVRTLFLRLRERWGVPLVVVNDGEVAALAGAMSLGVRGILGIALGSSEAAGYVDADGALRGWLDELAFAPVDYAPGAPVDEWSGDRGCGAAYFSQQCVFRLAPRVGLEPCGETKAARLKSVQRHLEAGEAGARWIWESIGVALGYAIAHYADFYPGLRHVLLMGRVTSGSGGPILIEQAERVLRGEFPALAEQVQLHLPDERSRRVGQAVAAASLPRIEKEG